MGLCALIALAGIASVTNYSANKYSELSNVASSVSSTTAPSIISFTAATSSVSSGTPVVLAWNTTGADTLSIDNGIGSVDASSTQSVSPATTTTYTLTAVNTAGTSTAQTTITVTAPTVSAPVVPSNPTPLPAFVANPGDMSGGGNFTNASTNGTVTAQYAALNTIGAGWARLNIYPSCYWANNVVNFTCGGSSTMDSAILQANQQGIQVDIYFEDYGSYNDLGDYNKWYAIGQGYANRYSPGSSWLTSQGISNWGVTVYQAINEPDIDGTIDRTAYAQALKGLADGVHSVNPNLKVVPGGFATPNAHSDFTMNGYGTAIASLLNDGTLDGIDLHTYHDLQFSPMQWQFSAQYDFDAIKAKLGITRDINFYSTEYNFKSNTQGISASLSAERFFTMIWENLGVVKDDGTQATQFALAWNLFNTSSSDPTYGLTTSLSPYTPTLSGAVYQMVMQETAGATFTSLDPKNTGVFVLSGANKKIWAWQDLPGWTNEAGTSFTVSNIPSSLNVLEVYGWDGIRQTIPLTGQTSYTVTGLTADQTYMFVASATTTSPEDLSDVSNPVALESTTTAPSIISFTAATSSVVTGTQVVLAWNTTGATTLSINNGIGSVAASSTQSVSPVTTTTYTLTAANTAGTSTAQATITVTAPVVSTPVITSGGGGGGGGGGGSSAPSPVVTPDTSGGGGGGPTETPINTGSPTSLNGAPSTVASISTTPNTTENAAQTNVTATGNMCPGANWSQNLQLKSSGPDVLALQQFLNTDPDTAIAVSGSGSSGQETGYYGALTALAVSKFQEKYAAQILAPNDLATPTGYFGTATRAEMNTLCAGEIQQLVPSVTPAPVPSTQTVTAAPSTVVTNSAVVTPTASVQTNMLLCPSAPWSSNLPEGSSGSDVLALQKFLNSNSVTQISSAGSGSSGQETGYYGPLTVLAVSKFQEKYAAQILAPNDLATPTGYFGTATRAQANTLCQ